MRKFWFFILFFYLILNGIALQANSALSTYKFQTGDSIDLDNVIVMRVKVVQGDTVLYDYIKEVIVFPRTFASKKDYLKYRKLVRDLKKVYPYAVIANDILAEMNEEFLKLQSEHDKSRYIDQIEKRLKAEFEEELKQMTIKQGKLLIKLIDRETGSTSYEIVRELKGSFSAFFWQTLAKLFGSDLKTQYDPHGEDKLIEEIVIQIQNGQL